MEEIWTEKEEEEEEDGEGCSGGKCWYSLEMASLLAEFLRILVGRLFFRWQSVGEVGARDPIWVRLGRPDLALAPVCEMPF